MRPEHQPTDENRRIIEEMAGFGIPEPNIARVVGIGETTMKKYYRDELDLGHTKATIAIAKNLFKIASGTGREAVTACIFWMKCRGGWSEYSPPPAPRPQAPGKKEMTAAEAETAQEDTGWANLVH